MSLVVAIDDLSPDRVRDKGFGAITTFFRATADTPNAPSAFLNRYVPGRVSSAHYHEIDQFQIMLDGKGKFGRHDVSPGCVHFSRAYTPYGPLLADNETGWEFLVLRTRYDPGPQRFPAAQAALKQVRNRTPWQITKKVGFPTQDRGVRVQDIAEIKDDQGLYARSLTMAPHTRTTAPGPAGGDGQFVVVTAGSLLHDQREHKALTVGFVKPDENAFEIHAGAQGLQALILNFPQVKPRARDTAKPYTAAGFRRWQCVLCEFAYDEALGLPAEGIPAGTRWQDVPDSWSCPDCSASKSDFQMVEV